MTEEIDLALHIFEERSARAWRLDAQDKAPKMAKEAFALLADARKALIAAIDKAINEVRPFQEQPK